MLLELFHLVKEKSFLSEFFVSFAIFLPELVASVCFSEGLSHSGLLYG